MTKEEIRQTAIDGLRGMIFDNSTSIMDEMAWDGILDDVNEDDRDRIEDALSDITLT